MKNKKNKIVLLIPSLQAGGMERVMSELANYFVSDETTEVYLVLYGITREIFYQISHKIKILRPGFNFNNRFRTFCTIRTALFIRCSVKKINPTSVLSFGEYWNSLVLISLFGLRQKVYISDRCQPDKNLGTMHNRIRKIVYRSAAGIIAQTLTAGEIFRSEIKHDNICVIGNPIREIDPDDSILKEKIVLMVGRIIKTKHQDKLIELFLKISKPGWRLVIVGYDHLKQNISENLKSIIAAHHAEKLVILEGKQADVNSYYLKSQIFAFTSSSEGFPNAIGEAMSAGLPVIAFDCIAGPSEMISDNESGFLIPVLDFQSFQNKLELLMDNEELRLSFGNKGKENIKKFSVEIIGSKYLKLLLSKSSLNPNHK